MFKRVFGTSCHRCDASFTKTEFEGLPTCKDCMTIIQAERERPRACPACSTTMHKHIVLNIITDVCPACHGAWLDGGELELLKKAIQEIREEEFASGFVLGIPV